MIETIRAVGMSICVTAVVTALFLMLSPDSKLERTLKFAVSLFFLAGLVSPFLGGDFRFSFDWEAPVQTSENARITRAAAEQFYSLAETRLEAALEALLKAEGIEAKKVRLQTTITAEGGISISRLEVTLPQGCAGKQKAVETLLLRETGILPEVRGE